MTQVSAAVYIDSPIRAAARQMVPFYHQGVFHSVRTPMLMRKRIGNGFGLAQAKRFAGVDIRMVDGQTAKKLPVKKGGAVFYGFNSQGNLHTVANRSYRHVLVLHGESNKRASARPAARLYDHVCVAGGLALDRYLRAGIFRESDADTDRLIRVGDTFVQSLDGYRVDPTHGDTLLYAPTWEGYGGEINNYCSIGIGGLEMARRAAWLRGCEHIVVRPHPYLGLLNPRLICQFISGLQTLSLTWPVSVDLRDANAVVRAAVQALALVSPQVGIYAQNSARVALCISDISAIEAICLKERLPNFTLLRNFNITSAVKPFYDRKSAGCMGELDEKLPAYLSDPEAVDAAHREASFSVTHPDFRSSDGATRFNRLMSIVAPLV